METIHDVAITLIVCVFASATVTSVGILLCTTFGAGFRETVWNTVKLVVSMASGVFSGVLGLVSAISILYVVLPDPLPIVADDVGMGVVALVTGVLSGVCALVSVASGRSVRFGWNGRPAMAGEQGHAGALGA